MAPIHDTDIAEERWSKAEWESYELWEKIEVRLKRRKLLIIAAAVAVFLMLSSIPIVMDQLPRWRAVTISRRLAQQINRLKREAGMDHQSYRITLNPDLTFVISRAARCVDASGWSEVRTGTLVPTGPAGYQLLNAAQGEELGIPGLAQQLCYDHLSGTQLPADGGIVGFATGFENDIRDRRLDRISILLVKGISGEMNLD